jgi:broad specificity phosphatase PhoE
MWVYLPHQIVHTRHPQCEHNFDHEDALARGIVNKHSPLTELGQLQRDYTAEYIVQNFPKFDAVFCSTYVRTRAIPERAQLAERLIEDARLDERNMGVWHRHSCAEVLRQYPGEEERLKDATYYYYHAPDGESCVHVEERLTDFLSDENKLHGCGSIYISGHGTAGRCLRKILTGATVEEWHDYEPLKNAAVNIFEKQGDRYVCTLWNHAPWEGHIDPAHLERRGGEV